MEIHYGGGYGFFHARARHFSLDFFDTALDRINEIQRGIVFEMDIERGRGVNFFFFFFNIHSRVRLCSLIRIFMKLCNTTLPHNIIAFVKLYESQVTSYQW